MKELTIIAALITLGSALAVTIGSVETAEKTAILNRMVERKAVLLRQLELYPNPSLEN